MDFPVYIQIVQTMQLPLVALIILLSFKTGSSAAIQELYTDFTWLTTSRKINPIRFITMGLIINLLYLLLTVNKTIHFLPIQRVQNDKLITVCNTLTSCCFYMAYIFLQIADGTFRISLSSPSGKKIRKMVEIHWPIGILMAVTILILLRNLLVVNGAIHYNWIYYLYDFFAYLLVSIYLYRYFSIRESRIRRINSNVYLFTGFFLWGILQVAAPLAGLIGLDSKIIELSAFSISALGKFLILYGLFSYYNRLAELTMRHQRRKNAQLESNLNKLTGLQQLINEASRAKSTSQLITTAMGHLTNKDLFSFDYVIFLKADYIQRRILYIDSHSVHLQIEDTRSWIDPEGIPFDHHHIAAQAFRKKENLQVYRNYINGEKVDLQSPLSPLPYDIFKRFHQQDLTRYFIPISKLGESKDMMDISPSLGDNSVVALVELGNWISERPILNGDRYDRQGELNIYLDNIIQSYYMLMDQEMVEDIGTELASCDDISEDRHYEYLDRVLRSACKKTGSDAGLLCLLPYGSPADIEIPHVHHNMRPHELSRIKVLLNSLTHSMVEESHTIIWLWEEAAEQIRKALRMNSCQKEMIGVKERVMGCVYIFSNKKQFYNKDSQRFLEWVTHPLPKLFNEKRFHNAVAALVAPNNALTDPEENIEPIMSSLSNYFGTPYIGVWLKESRPDASLGYELRYHKGNLRYRLSSSNPENKIGQEVGKMPEFELIRLDTPEPTGENDQFWKFGSVNKIGMLIHVPLRSEHQQYGFINIYFRSPISPLFQQDRQFLELVSTKCSMTLQVQYLLRSFMDISSSFSRNELNNILQTITDKAMELLDADPVILFKSENGLDVFFKGVTYSHKEQFNDPKILDLFAAGEGHVELAELILKSESSYFATLPEYQIFMQRHERNNARVHFRNDFWTREGIRSMAAIQLINKTGKTARVIGVMFINFRRPTNFNDETKRVIQTFASFAAGAIENGFVFEKNRQYLLRNLRLTKPMIGQMMVTGALHDAGKTFIGAYSQYSNIKAKYDDTGHKKQVDLIDVRGDLKIFKESLDKMKVHFKKIEGIYKPGQLLQIKEYNLSEILKEQLYIIQQSFKGKIIYVNQSAMDERVNIQCDGALIGHVFYNLLNNAYHAMNNRGHLEIRIAKINDREIRVDVIDDGKGINKDIYDIITEPYITDKPDGSGLGLAMSKLTIEEQHGGKLHYGSKDKKTRFTIILPIRQKINTFENINNNGQ